MSGLITKRLLKDYGDRIRLLIEKQFQGNVPKKTIKKDSQKNCRNVHAKQHHAIVTLPVSEQTVI